MDVKYIECKRKDFIGTRQFILDLQEALDDGYRLSTSDKMKEMCVILPYPRFRLEKEVEDKPLSKLEPVVEDTEASVEEDKPKAKRKTKKSK